MAEAVMGTSEVNLLMEAACVIMAQNACKGCDKQLSSAVLTAAKTGCKDRNTLAIQLTQLAVAQLEPQQREPRLKELAAEHLSAEMLEQAMDDKLQQASGRLHSALNKSNTADRALGQLIVESAGLFIVEHGMQAWVGRCESVHSAGTLRGTSMR